MFFLVIITKSITDLLAAVASWEFMPVVLLLSHVCSPIMFFCLNIARYLEATDLRLTEGRALNVPGA